MLRLHSLGVACPERSVAESKGARESVRHISFGPTTAIYLPLSAQLFDENAA